MYRSLDRAMVLVEIDATVGLGWLYVHPDASSADIRQGLALLDDAGYEELDSLETGDDLVVDEQGRTVIPLVKKWDGMEGD